MIFREKNPVRTSLDLQIKQLRDRSVGREQKLLAYRDMVISDFRRLKNSPEYRCIKGEFKNLLTDMQAIFITRQGEISSGDDSSSSKLLADLYMDKVVNQNGRHNYAAAHMYLKDFTSVNSGLAKLALEHVVGHHSSREFMGVQAILLTCHILQQEIDQFN